MTTGGNSIQQLVAGVALTLVCLLSPAANGENWDDVLAEARGQTVYFNAWGGDLAINRYLEWAAGRLQADFDIGLRHVRVTDIAEAVTRIAAERAGGRLSNGSVDLLWVNGENFAALKRAGLLFGPWARELPNATLIDWQGNPTTLVDGGLKTEGFELPWGTAALTLFYDPARVESSIAGPADLLAWIERHPGRFSYPQPPAFLGSAFLKQMLLLLTNDVDRLGRPVDDDFDAVSAPLWAWLDRAHPGMWREGRLFPPSGPAQRDLLAVGELDWMLSYNPAEASRAIRQDELNPGIRGLYLDGAALANSHFLAIPFNASATAGARVVANFLVSAEAQARKADERIWGDPTVLDFGRLAPEARAQFTAVGAGAATPPPPERLIAEPHPSWTLALEKAWLVRYTRGAKGHVR